MFRSLRNLWRLFGIARTLARHDALFPLERVPVAPAVLWLARFARRRNVPGRPGERLARALVALGPSFVKLGQTLATRSDLLGDEIAADLSALQDRLAPFDAAAAMATIEAELGEPVARLFASIEAVPVAAASIAQVHFAVTAEGEPVAVKVLRPGIERAFGRDLDFFYWLAEMAELAVPGLRRLKPVAAVATFADTVAMEMDLRLEASAAAELAANFRADPEFRVPRVDWRRTARRVLTLERVQGIRIDRVDALRAAGHDPDRLLAAAAAAFFRQVFRDGFFHADMHPGNMFIDAAGMLVPVDFGIMGRLDLKTRHYLADMLIGFLSGDYRGVAEVHFRAGYVSPHKSVELFTQACRSIGEPIMGRPLREISIARLLAQLFQVTETFEMEAQPQLLLLQKTMLVAEGVGRALNPDVNMWELARPLMEAWVRENRGPEARLAETAGALGRVIARLPATLDTLELAVDRMAGGQGLHLHPETVRLLADRLAERRGRLAWLPWLVVGAIALAALL
ncbi:MAG: 2-polyprenylphenol 6-hydroxylase [Thalassobaculales bacterium]